MRNLKKLLACTLTVAMALSLAACGGSSSSGGGATTSTTKAAEATKATEGATQPSAVANGENASKETETLAAVEEVSSVESGTSAEEKTSEASAQEPTYDYRDPSIFKVKNGIAHAPKAKVSGVTADDKGFILKNVDKFSVFQGACTDGEYAYAILENQMVPTDTPGKYGSEGMLFKIDMKNWEIAAQSEALPLDHGNDVVYNPKTGLLMVVNNKGHTNRLTLVDPETLTVTDTVDLDYKIYGLSYNETRDCYVAGISGTYDFVLLDGDFQKIKLVPGIDTGFTKQNIDSDDDYIYFVQYNINSIICYNWEGEYVGVYYVSGNYTEAESLFHVGDDFYMGFYAGGGNGGTIWAIDVDRSVLK